MSPRSRFFALILAVAIAGFGSSGIAEEAGTTDGARDPVTLLVRESDPLLRKTARAEGVGLLGVEYPLEVTAGRWVRGKPREDRVRLAVTEIDERDIPARTGLEFRGYLFAAETGISGVDFTVSGDLTVWIDGRVLAVAEPAAAATPGDTVSRSQFAELEEGLHTFRVEYRNLRGQGRLRLRAGPAEDEIVRFRVGPALIPDGTGGEERPVGQESEFSAESDPLVTVSRKVREAFLHPALEGGLTSSPDGSAAGGESERGGFDLSGPIRPYRLFFENFGKGLRSCPGILSVTTEPATDYSACLRAGEGTGFLFLSGEREPAWPAAIPSAAFSLQIPGRHDRVEFPLATRLSLSGDRPYILPLNWDVGGLALLSTTAQPVCVFESGEETNLVAAAEDDRKVEFTFSGSDLKYQGKPWMSAHSVTPNSMTVACVPAAGGRFSVSRADGAAIYVKPISVPIAERVSLWPASNGYRLVDSNVEAGAPEGERVPVRMLAGNPVRIRIYPGRDVAGLQWDGTRYPAQRRGDWAEVFFNPEGPLVRAGISGPEKVEILAFQVDSSVKSINLRVRYQGGVAEAWSGDRLLARSDGAAPWWKIPILDDIRAGMRQIRFGFPEGEGRILDVRTETVVEKMAEIVLADDNEPRSPD